MYIFPDKNSRERVFDKHQRYIPEYYPYMHLDGYEPWEILVAKQKKSRRRFYERMAAKEKTQESEIPMNVKFNVEIKKK